MIGAAFAAANGISVSGPPGAATSPKRPLSSREKRLALTGSPQPPRTDRAVEGIVVHDPSTSSRAGVWVGWRVL